MLQGSGAYSLVALAARPNTETVGRLTILPQSHLAACLVGAQIGTNAMLGTRLAILADVATRQSGDTILLAHAAPIQHAAFLGTHAGACAEQQGNQHQTGANSHRCERDPLASPDATIPWR